MSAWDASAQLRPLRKAQRKGGSVTNVHGLQDGELKRRTSTRRGGHIDDEAAAYSLGALEPTDHARIKRHLRSCPRCARLVEADQRTVAFLPFLTPASTPRPEVKTALFARIAARPGIEFSPTAAHHPPPLTTLPSSRPSSSGGSPSSMRSEAADTRQRRRPMMLTLRPSIIAPLVLALTLVGFWALDVGTPFGSRLSDPQQENARLHADNGYVSTGLNADTGDGEATIWDSLAISDANPDITEDEISHAPPVIPSRIGDGLLSATGLRVDVGQRPLPVNPAGFNASPSMRLADISA